MSFVVHPAHREPHCYWKGWVDRSATTPKWSDRLQALRQQRQPALSLHTLGAIVAASLNESAILELDCIIYIVQIAVYLDDIPFTKGYYCPVVSELAFHVLIPAQNTSSMWNCSFESSIFVICPSKLRIPLPLILCFKRTPCVPTCVWPQSVNRTRE